MSPAAPRPWWETAVIYQIYPRSFCDTDGDGVGDLEGIRRHLDHLSWLGVDTIWLSPFYPSPMADFGYDVADFCGVDPLFGTLADFDRLASECRSRGLRLIVDWVPNHSSDQHPWFVDSRSSRSAPHRDWYWWRDGRRDADGGSGPPGSPGRLPNNWLSAFPTPGGRTLPPAWTWDERTGQWYLHLFLPAQPDLNWENPDVRAAMAETLRFWMARGVSGFRVDVAHGLGKDPALPDSDQQPVSGFNDQAVTHGILAGLRQVVDDWPDDPPRMMVGEVYLPTTAQVATYYGSPERPELHLSFNFPPLFAAWDDAEWTERIREVEDLIVARGHWPTWVLSNHDQSRHRTRYGSEARARAAAVLLLTLRGTPFVYAGEELGLEDAVVPPDQRVDPGGRDGCRAPLPWDDGPTHGWSAAQDPWLPWPPGVDTGRTVTALRSDPASILHLYRRLLALRAASPALRSGSLALVAARPDVVAYRRSAPGDDRLVAVNFADAPATVTLPDGPWRLDLASGDGPAIDGSRLTLGADQAVVASSGTLPSMG